MNLNAALGSLSAGLAVAVFVFGAREWIARGFLWIEDDLKIRLRRMRVSTRHLRKYLIVWIAVLILTYGTFVVFLQSQVFGLLTFVFLGATPWYYVRRLSEQHREKIEDQLADAMVTMASAVKAGLSLAQALDVLATQCPKPIDAEFHQIVAEYNMGKPLDKAITEAKVRLESENFSLFAAAMQASHESGGRLNETIERIAKSVLEMQRLERKVKSETAQARKSAVYMAIAPFIILVVYYFVDPVNTTMLFTEVFGHLLLAVAIVLDVIAYFWARAILNPDI